MTTKTNQEIDHALALAIGYSADRVQLMECRGVWDIQVLNGFSRADGPIKQREPDIVEPYGWQRFDHKDPAVFAAIGKTFDCFPRRSSDVEPADWWTVKNGNEHFDSNIPERATALAVIDHCKKGKS